jgi:DNA-directed RNA polymerase subunit K/omega
MSSLRRSNKTINEDDDNEKETKEGVVSEEEEDVDEEEYDDDEANDTRVDKVEEDEDDNVNDDEDEVDENDEDNEDDEEPNEDNKEEGENANVEEEEGEEEEEDDDSGLVETDYLKKFTSEKNKNYIKDFHPEISSHNYEEVKLLSVITRDKNGIIIDSLHKTTPVLTKFEKTRILGQRAKQLDSGAKPLVEVPRDMIEGYLIAKLELAGKKIPFIIKRPIPNGGCEYWNVNDLEDL